MDPKERQIIHSQCRDERGPERQYQREYLHRQNRKKAFAPRNLNYRWAEIAVSELIRLGVRTFAVSPGMRNAPLVAALVEARASKAAAPIEVFSFKDERQAGFFALGWAKVKGEACALMCTSGTAMSHYWPSLLEAYYSGIPYLVVSADRPEELVHTGANQTMDQKHFFHQYAPHFCQLPSPSKEVDPNQLRAHLELATRELKAGRGPVHLNMPFSDQLAPHLQEDVCPELPELPLFEKKPAPAVAATFPGKLTAPTLFATGQWAPHSDEQKYLKEFFEQQDKILLYTDMASQFRGKVKQDLGPFPRQEDFQAALLGSLERIFILGGTISSKPFLIFLKKAATAGIPIFRVVTPTMRGRFDPVSRAQLIEAPSAADFIKDFDSYTLPRKESSRPSLPQVPAPPQEQLAILSTPSAMIKFSERCPVGADIFIGNSTLWRAFDDFVTGFKKARDIKIYSQRALSGIDGLLAQSLAIALHPESLKRPFYLFVGDVTLLHDLSSLLLTQELPLAKRSAPFYLIVVNNQGGRIFEKLPVASAPHIVEPFMNTPHGHHFESIARGFSYQRPLNYQSIDHMAAWEKFLDLNARESTPALHFIELKIPPETDQRSWPTL